MTADGKQIPINGETAILDLEKRSFKPPMYQEFPLTRVGESDVSWRINNIHPFINGNGRTARATCYFALCVAAGGLLPGSKVLPELIRQNRQEYCDALQVAHDSFAQGNLDLSVLHALVSRLVNEQLQSAATPPAATPGTSVATPASNTPSTASTQGGQALS
jgi:hypothetical protein